MYQNNATPFLIFYSVLSGILRHTLKLIHRTLFFLLFFFFINFQYDICTFFLKKKLLLQVGGENRPGQIDLYLNRSGLVEKNKV